MNDPAVLLALLWACIVVIGAWKHRPAPARVAVLIASCDGGSVRSSALMKVGRLVRRVAGRAADPAEPIDPADAAADRRAGAGAVVVILAAIVSPFLAVGVSGVLVVWSRVTAQRRRGRGDELVLASMPETIDLFVLAAGAGHTVPRALQLVSVRADGRVGDELRDAARRVRHGERTADALDAVAASLGEPVRPLVGVLCTSERYGTPLVPALERLAAEARLGRRRRAEEAARRVPVKLLFPLVLCTLPAFALLTVVPLLVGAFDSLRL